MSKEKNVSRLDEEKRILFGGMSVSSWKLLQLEKEWPICKGFLLIWLLWLSWCLHLSFLLEYVIIYNIFFVEREESAK